MSPHRVQGVAWADKQSGGRDRAGIGAARADRFSFFPLVSVILDRDTAITEQHMTVAEQLYEQAKLLPQPLAQEALDFVLFLRSRQDRGEWRDLMNAQSDVLAEVWNNEEDKAWDNV